MNEEKPGWVAMRATCQIDTVFEDLLKAVQQDVDAMNKLPAEQRGPCRYKYDRQTSGAFVSRTYENGDTVATDYDPRLLLSVIFRNNASGEGIKIIQHLIKHSKDQYVTLIWNAENLSCEIIWDGNKDCPLEVWQVSQKALEPLFFSNDEE